MKHLKLVLLGLLVSPLAFLQAADYPQNVIDTCTIVTDEERKLAKPEPSDLEREIMRLDHLLCFAYNAGDMGPVMDMTHENAKLFPPGFDIVPGKEAIGQVYAMFSSANSGEEGYELAWEPIDAMASGDMAWAYGIVTVKAPGIEKERGKYISIWRKENDKWYYVVEIRNANQ